MQVTKAATTSAKPPAQAQPQAPVVKEKEPTTTPSLIAKSSSQRDSPVDAKKTLDLDTRIAMLLRDKAGGMAPPFLQFGSDSEEEAKSQDEEMLSTPPSPFLSTEIYKACYDKLLERNKGRRKSKENNVNQFSVDDELGSVISSSEDEALLGSYSPALDGHEPVPPKEPPQLPPPPDDDRMSLSSLSSGDEKIEEVIAQSAPPVNQLYPGAGYPGHLAHYPPPMADVYQWPRPAQYPYPLNTTYLPSHYQAIHTAIPGTLGNHQGATNYYPSFQTRLQQMQSNYNISKDNPQGPTINEVLNRVVNELKQILKKDFNKKMVENTAFKLFEVWWDEKKTAKPLQNDSSEATAVSANNVVKEDNQKGGLSSLLDATAPLGMNYDGFGLGIRASMPKMPSFRRKIKTPSPVAQDEDSRQSDSRTGAEPIDSESDTELPLIVQKPKRKLTSGTSSSSSSSSDSSSESSSDESGSDSTSTSSSDSSDEEGEEDSRLLASQSTNAEVLVELALLRSLDCPTPTGRMTPVVDVAVRDGEFPQLNNEASPECSPLRETIKDEETTVAAVDNKYERPKTPDIDVDKLKAAAGYSNENYNNIKEMFVKSELQDIQRKESSAAEALISLAGQDNIIRHTSPVGQVQPNIIRVLETMSTRYINNEPILKEDEKIEMFSEIPTTDSEEESLEIRRLRYQAEADHRLNGQTAGTPRRQPLSQVYIEHSYSLPPTKPDGTATTPTKAQQKAEAAKKAKAERAKIRAEKRKLQKYSQQLPPSHEGEKENILNDFVKQQQLVVPPPKVTFEPPKVVTFEPPKPAPIVYKERNLMLEMTVLYEFLTRGIDAEDIEYLRRSYETLLADDAQGYWLNDTHWVDHHPTDIPTPAKKRRRDEVRIHATGSARTEGYYKVDIREKAKHKVSVEYLFFIANTIVFENKNT